MCGRSYVRVRCGGGGGKGGRGYNKYCTWLESCKIGIMFFRGLVFVGVCGKGGTMNTAHARAHTTHTHTHTHTHTPCCEQT